MHGRREASRRARCSTDGEVDLVRGGFRVLVRDDGVLVRLFVVAGLVVVGSGVVGFGGFFVMMGGGAVGFVCHGNLQCPDCPGWEMLGPGMFHRYER